MRIVERSNLACSVELLDQTLDLGRVGVSARSESLELRLELVLLSEFAKHLSEIDTLLTGDLGSRSVLRSGTITDSVCALRTQKCQVIVDNQSSTLGLRIRKARHQFPGDSSRSVSGSPDEQTVRNLLHLLVGVLDSNAHRSDVLDHGSGKDIDLVGSESVFGVLDELLGECGQDVGKGFDKGDLESIGDFRVPLLQVVLDVSVTSTAMSAERLTIKKSCNSPAYSTPVGPPPTTTMCINRSISA